MVLTYTGLFEGYMRMFFFAFSRSRMSSFMSCITNKIYSLMLQEDMPGVNNLRDPAKTVSCENKRNIILLSAVFSVYRLRERSNDFPVFHVFYRLSGDVSLMADFQFFQEAG